MGSSWWMWVAVAGVVVAFVGLDLAWFHRGPGEVTIRDAIAWSSLWLAVGLGFAGVVWWWLGGGPAKEYAAGYVIERSLSLDNLFVLAVILGYFAVPDAYRHRALLWGIAGALVFRTLFIAAGAVALDRFAWLAYLLGAFLVLTGLRLARRTVEAHPERNPVVAVFRRVVPMTTSYRGQRLLVRRGGRLVATPMVVVLIAIATTDVAFATDSIPAIYGVTDDPFLVFAANAFSVLGLLALYFLLAALIVRFRYLRPATAAILVVVGVKMAVEDLVRVSATASLAVVVGIVAVAVLASVVHPELATGAAERPSTNAMSEARSP